MRYRVLKLLVISAAVLRCVSGPVFGMDGPDGCLMYQQIHDHKPSAQTIRDIRQIDDAFRKGIKILDESCRTDLMAVRAQALVHCDSNGAPEPIAIQWDKVLTDLGLPFKKREALSTQLYLAAVPTRALLGLPQRDYIASLFAAFSSLEKCS